MPLTILVAEDDPGTRLSVSDYLESQGYIVFSADNGKDALALAQAHHPHLIITDIAMPQMDGYELVRQVRRSLDMRLLPIIFLTGKADVPHRVLGYQLGCDVYLQKPFEFTELSAVIRNLLDRAQILMDWKLSRESGNLAGGNGDAPPQQAFSSMNNLNPPRTFSVDLSNHLEFSQREQDVLKLLSKGLSNIQIGEQLHLSPRTIEKHVSSLLRKTGTGNRAELVRYAVEHHLVI
ncbi:response regulator transcription factor [Alkalinema sp. FACHB-956]|uniref:response regulator transcription factor n=1 Tax=Alkalinema sp. FACHB-956 TaxID=2692768 RepID=UPI001683F82C|nr:response regulator transcription factor [Alkalinema sp. FACHB-956]MBD2326383.1 response regulator transcription factor [Alkalinema sp. FACHB-956]